MTNVTNFRGMNIKAADYRSSELYERLFTQFSQDYLRIPAAPDKYFFKAQKEIYDKFSAKFLSYSAPTSLGKSYVMRMYIKEKIEKYGDGNFTIVVPTKALINEVTANITEDLGNILYEKNYRIVTSAGAVALEEEHNFIFVMTPERLLYLLILLPDMPMEYLFVDEAHLYFNKKTGISLDVLTSISQQRKDRRRIILSSQIWEDLDISLRKQVKEVVNCRRFGFLQINTILKGETLHWDKFEGAYIADKDYTEIFKHNDWLYSRYDTRQKIIKNDKYNRTITQNEPKTFIVSPKKGLR